MLTCRYQWLAKKGRNEEARRILVKYHANGKEDDPLVEYEWREIQEALREEEINSQTKYTDFLRGSGNRRRLLILMVVSVGTNWVGMVSSRIISAQFYASWASHPRQFNCRLLSE